MEVSLDKPDKARTNRSVSRTLCKREEALALRQNWARVTEDRGVLSPESFATPEGFATPESFFQLLKRERIRRKSTQPARIRVRIRSIIACFSTIQKSAWSKWNGVAN